MTTTDPVVQHVSGKTPPFELLNVCAVPSLSWQTIVVPCKNRRKQQNNRRSRTTDVEPAALRTASRWRLVLLSLHAGGRSDGVALALHQQNLRG